MAAGALNSVEMVSVPWWFLEVTGAKDNGLTGWLESRLDHVERVLKEREWLAAGRFTVADLLMADVLRAEKVRAFGDRPATESYLTRITERPAFKKAQRLDAAVQGNETLSYFQDLEPGTYVLIGEPFTRTLAGIPALKSEEGKQIRNANAGALERLVASGRYQEIFAARVLEANALERIEINAGE
jgi:hypothetical protein